MLYFEQQCHFDLQFHVAKLYFICSFKFEICKIHWKHREEVNSVLGTCDSQKSTIREIGIIYACSDHGQSEYQIWIKYDKRQMTSCVHKMCERTYGQTNMKRTITLAKINAYIIPISRMVDFCESYSPFHVPLRAAAINYFLN
jgi:hypothetical protein